MHHLLQLHIDPAVHLSDTRDKDLIRTYFVRRRAFEWKRADKPLPDDVVKLPCVLKWLRHCMQKTKELDRVQILAMQAYASQLYSVIQDHLRGVQQNLKNRLGAFEKISTTSAAYRLLTDGNSKWNDAKPRMIVSNIRTAASERLVDAYQAKREWQPPPDDADDNVAVISFKDCEEREDRLVKTLQSVAKQKLFAPKFKRAIKKFQSDHVKQVGGWYFAAHVQRTFQTAKSMEAMRARMARLTNKQWGAVLDEVVRDIDASIEALPPLPCDLVVYRGVKTIGKGLTRARKTTNDKGFMSVSLSASTARRFAGKKCCLLEITVPAGTRVLPVTMSVYNEQEVLLPRGIRCSTRIIK